MEELERAGKRQAAPFADGIGWRDRGGRVASEVGEVCASGIARRWCRITTKVAKLQGCPECGGKLKMIHTR